tara:strand:+ start:2182 stop:4356 length:2175 start_codon:yes stop_codon:yes gene_type:complete
MPEYAGHKMSKKDLKNFHKDMKDMAKKEKPMSEKEMNDMAKEYNKEAMEVYSSYLDELKTSTLSSYKKKAESDKERLRDRAHELVQRDSQQLGGRYAMPDADNAADKYERADRREKGIAMAKKKIDKKKVDSAPRLTKEEDDNPYPKHDRTDQGFGSKKLNKKIYTGLKRFRRDNPRIQRKLIDDLKKEVKLNKEEKMDEAKANPKDYYEVSGTKLTKELMDKLVKARKKEMNDKKVLKGTPVHYEEYGAGFMGTDALRKKYENETPGQNTNPYKLAVDGVPTKDGIKKPMVETKGAPKGYHFTRSGKLRKGDANQDGPGGKMLRSDPLDKQRSKIPPLPEEVNKKDEKGLKKLSDMLKGSAGAHLDQKKKLDKLIANEEKFKVKNCGCDKDPCETYGSKEEQMKAHMEGYIGDQLKDRIKSKLHPDRMERNKAARRADTRKHNRKVVQSAIKSEIGRMMQNKEKKMDEGLIIERIKISAVTPKGRKTYRYAGTPVDAQKKVAQLRKSGHASISTVEEEYVSEGKMKDLYMKQQAEAERKKLMQRSKPKKKKPNKVMKDIGYSGGMANEENLNELDTDTIKSAYDKRKKQAFDHEYAAGDHASSAEHAKTKEAEKTHRAFQKQRQAKHMKASKGKAIANRALKRKGYSGALDYRLQKGGEDDRYEDERKGRLKENYRRQTGYRKPANWKTNANHLVGQKGNNLTKGRNMVYLLKYLISRSGLAK